MKAQNDKPRKDRIVLDLTELEAIALRNVMSSALDAADPSDRTRIYNRILDKVRRKLNNQEIR